MKETSYHMAGQYYHFIPPENTRKPNVFWCFHDVQNFRIDQKWINTVLNNITTDISKQYLNGGQVA